MRWLFKLIILTGCVFFIFPSATAQSWDFQTEKDGVKIYNRWIKLDNGRETREIKGIVMVNASIDQVLESIRGDGAGKWIDRAVELYHFRETEGGKSWYTYTEFDLPWPLDNQDQITLNKLKIRSDKEYHISTRTVEGILPEKKGKKRMKEFYGDWVLNSLAPNKTQIEYRALTKAEPAFPRWISDPVVEKSTINTMSGLREYTKKNIGK